MLTDGTAAMFLYRGMQWARRCRMLPLEILFNKHNASARKGATSIPATFLRVTVTV